ncbi:MAG TPA: cytochrome c [Verrucomicrobiae bacterium]|jgi:mono/diheme cytochrome c family protein|nr:cytochrome c [Verrucomicrobiae bacterium]
MTSRLILIGPLLLLVAVMCAAQQVKITYQPIKDVSPASGEEMYVAYCAACHGMDGKGAGPAASASKATPKDLTRLASSNGGKFPSLRVCYSILGDTRMARVHGNNDMPAWGSLFSSRYWWRTTAKAEAWMRAASLTDYVGSLQKK